MVLQQVGEVTSPWSLQVDSPTSFRASLVSWVQGMQIGLNEIPKTIKDGKGDVPGE